MGVHQTEKKRQPTDWEKIFANDISHKINSKNNSHNSTSEQQTINFKMGRAPDISPKNIYRWPTNMKKNAQYHKSGKCKSKSH